MLCFVGKYLSKNLVFITIFVLHVFCVADSLRSSNKTPTLI